MADEDDQAPQEEQDPAPRAPWTIKGMSVETRRAAAAAATKQGMPMGVWIDAAVWDRVRREAGGMVPPAESEPPSPGRPAVPFPNSVPTQDATTMASLLQAYVEFAASAKVPTDKALVEEYAALLRELMRRMREPARDPQ